MPLQPIEPHKDGPAHRLKLDQAGDYITYLLDPEGRKDWSNIHLVSSDGTAAWSTGAVVHFRVGNDGVNFLDPPGGASTLTGYGVSALRTITGFIYGRLIVTTAGNSTTYATPHITAGVTNG